MQVITEQTSLPPGLVDISFIHSYYSKTYNCKKDWAGSKVTHLPRKSRTLLGKDISVNGTHLIRMLWRIPQYGANNYNFNFACPNPAIYYNPRENHRLSKTSDTPVIWLSFSNLPKKLAESAFKPLDKVICISFATLCRRFVRPPIPPIHLLLLGFTWSMSITFPIVYSTPITLL